MTAGIRPYARLRAARRAGYGQASCGGLVAGLARRLGAHVRSSCRRTGDVTAGGVIFNLQTPLSQRIRWDVTALPKELCSNNQQPCTKNVTD